MTDNRDTNETRRKILKAAGSTVLLAPAASLIGCSGEKDATPDAPVSEAGVSPDLEAPIAAADEAAAAGEQTAEALAKDTSADSGNMPRLSEDDPQAKSLAYVHDATAVDQSEQPRYEPGQACSNCALYMDGEAEWGECSIFAGKLVKGTGWCSVYTPRPA